MEDDHQGSDGGTEKPSSFDQEPHCTSAVENGEEEMSREVVPSKKRERDVGSSEIDNTDSASKKRNKTDNEDLRDDGKKVTGANILSPVVTRSRAMGKRTAQEIASNSTTNSPKRWRVHQMAEDYIQLAANMMLPATQLRPYGYDPDRREYPLEGTSILGYLKSPIRRPSVIEDWSPREIALFEAGLFHHGKEFHLVSRIVETKSTKQVIDFYYVWKKTSHYKQWKDQYIPDELLVDIESPVKGKL